MKINELKTLKINCQLKILKHINRLFAGIQVKITTPERIVKWSRKNKKPCKGVYHPDRNNIILRGNVVNKQRTLIHEYLEALAEELFNVYTLDETGSKMIYNGYDDEIYTFNHREIDKTAKRIAKPESLC